MIHGLFIVYESFYEEEGLKRNITLIILMMKNIFNIYINVDKNMIGHLMIFTHYLLYNININKNMIGL
jgi:hypothetical protein